MILHPAAACWSRHLYIPLLLLPRLIRTHTTLSKKTYLPKHSNAPCPLPTSSSTSASRPLQVQHPNAPLQWHFSLNRASGPDRAKLRPSAENLPARPHLFLPSSTSARRYRRPPCGTCVHVSQIRRPLALNIGLRLSLRSLQHSRLPSAENKWRWDRHKLLRLLRSAVCLSFLWL